MEEKLEKRMYFFVSQNMAPIYMGIQAGHAALEYAVVYGNRKEFQNFMMFHKTWIILNGGTTNDPTNGLPIGTLDQIAADLRFNKIRYSWFREPDLNNALTALCFICDERVFNKTDYPDFNEFLFDADTELYEGLYEKWFDSIGGKQNLFLRNLLNGKKLA